MNGPTHILRTLTGSYLVDLSVASDYELIFSLIGSTNGNIKVTHMVEDNSKYDQKQYHDKIAIISCRSLVSLEEI